VFQLFEVRPQIQPCNGEFFPGETNRDDRFVLTARNGLTYFDITALNEDLAGNVWLGTNNSGFIRVERNGLSPTRAGWYLFSQFVFGDRATRVFEGTVLGDKRTSVFRCEVRYPRPHSGLSLCASRTI
jgi:hypothetical protein